MQGQWHVSMAGQMIIAGPNDLENAMNECRGESKSRHGASAEVYLVRHVQISEDDIESISTAASMQLVHGLLAIHHHLRIELGSR